MKRDKKEYYRNYYRKRRARELSEKKKERLEFERKLDKRKEEFMKSYNVKRNDYLVNMDLEKLALDIDHDGALDYKDCKPFDRKKQHTKRWKKRMLRNERLKREYSNDMMWYLSRGFTEKQAVSKIKKKSSSNLKKLMLRHNKAMKIPDATAICADDIRRTKDVVKYIDENKLRDLGSEIRL